MISAFLSLQGTKRNQELADRLVKEMDSHFLEHAMYDINDALASILALCDVEGVKVLPKIKGYIERINTHLYDVKVYQKETLFNINHVLKNVVNIVEDNFKDAVRIDYSSSPVKALAETNQTKLEYLLLYILIELADSNQNAGESEILVELLQNQQDAQILIMKDNYSFSQTALRVLDDLRSDFSGRIQILPKDNGIEIDIRLPLSFKNTPSIKGFSPSSEIKIQPKKPAKGRVDVINGAQERT